MPALTHPPSEDRPINNLGRGDEEAIQTYLEVTDDGEIARLAAIMAPKGEVFDAPAQVAQATALQAEVTSELVRRREAIASSMSYVSLLELAGHFGFGDIGFLQVADEERFDDSITGPVLRSLAKLMRAMPPPQDFLDHFLAEDPTATLELAGLTKLTRPLPSATFEETLRYAANIPTDEVSWDILNGAFFDFQRLWFQKALLMAELFEMNARLGLKKAESSELSATIKRIQQKLTSLHDAFTPGQEFPSDINELAHRAYAECWENGLFGPLWRRRLAWLVIEFTPFWQRYGAAYLAVHQVRVKAKLDAAAVLRDVKNKKSAKAKKSGEVGRQRRESKRWRSVTADFIKFLKTTLAGSAPSELGDCVATFVGSSPSLGGDQQKANILEFLQTLCTAVTADVEARIVLDTLQHSLLVKINALKPALRNERLNKLLPNQRNQYLEKGTIPPGWVQFKSLTEVAVRDCLEDLKHALPKVRGKKVEK